LGRKKGEQEPGLKVGSWKSILHSWEGEEGINSINLLQGGGTPWDGKKKKIGGEKSCWKLLYGGKGGRRCGSYFLLLRERVGILWLFGNPGREEVVGAGNLDGPFQKKKVK